MPYTHQEIMTIANNALLTPDENISKLIDIGIKELELQLGIVSHVKGDDYTVIHTNNSELLGQKFSLGVTYCSITLSLVAKRIFAVKHFSVSDYFRHPAHKAFQLETYIGAPIMINGKSFGTLNFTQPIVRIDDFTTEEKELVKSLSEGIASNLQRKGLTTKGILV